MHGPVAIFLHDFRLCCASPSFIGGFSTRRPSLTLLIRRILSLGVSGMNGMMHRAPGQDWPPGVSLICRPGHCWHGGQPPSSPTTNTPVMAANGGSWLWIRRQALGGIFGCSADGGKQTTEGCDRRRPGRPARQPHRRARAAARLGTILGGVVGAAAGSALGCKLQKNDRAKAEKAMEDALAKGEDQSMAERMRPARRARSRSPMPQRPAPACPASALPRASNRLAAM
jgi:hypothetical protein